MLKVSFGSLKQSADNNFRLEFLILPSSDRLKPTCDTRIIHLYYTLEQLYDERKRTKKCSLRMRNLKQTELQRLKNKERKAEDRMQKR